jgi:hypothetical protein
MIFTLGQTAWDNGELTWTGTVLTAILIEPTYTPVLNSTYAEVIAHEVTATGYSRQFLSARRITTTDTDFTYYATAPIWSQLNGGDARYLLIADITNEIPFALLGTNEIELVGADIVVVWDEALSQVRIYDRTDWIRLQLAVQLTSESATDFNTTQTTTDITNEPHPNNLISACNCRIGGVSVLSTIPYDSQDYDRFEAQLSTDSATDFNVVATRNALEDDLITYAISICSCRAGGVSVLSDYRQPQLEVGVSTFNYTIPSDNLVPLLTAIRSADFTTATLDIQNTIATAYDIQIQSADNQQATFGGGYDNTDEVTALPFVDTVANTRLNYKYRGRFQITGTIDGSPVTVNGAWSAPRYTVGKGQTIV